MTFFASARIDNRTPAYFLFLLYVTTSYLLQFVGDITGILPPLGDEFSGFDTARVLVWYLPLFSFFFYLIVRYVRMPMPSFPRLVDWLFENRAVTWTVGLISISLGLKFYIELGVTFRQDGPRMSDVGGWLLILMIARMYIKSWIFYKLMCVIRSAGSDETVRRQRLLALVYTVSMGLIVTGGLDIPFVATLGIYACISDKALTALLCNSRQRNGSALKRAGKLAVVCLAGLLVAAGGAFIGIYNKIGQAGIEAMAANSDFFFYWFGHIFVRLSSSYCSLQAVGSHHPLDLSLQLQALAVPFHTLMYRVSMFLHGGIDRPAMTQLMRLNYVTYLVHPTLELAGASPGLFASSLYFPGFPLNIIVFALYLAFYVRAIGHVLGRSKMAISIAGQLVILFFFLPFLESPIDFTVVIDPDVIYFILVNLFLGKLIYDSRTTQPCSTH